MLICPVCHTKLVKHASHYRCRQAHNYDIAKEGYVNLHVVQHKNSHHAGDTKSSLQARQRFLARGYYAPLNAVVSDIVAALAPNKLLDIGCGEGYYTRACSHYAQETIALDIAKVAIQLAAKADRVSKAQMPKPSTPRADITWAVGTAAALPVADDCIDVCLSLFAPLPKDELIRVMRLGGHLIVASPAPSHLYALRAALFDHVREHDAHKWADALMPQFSLIDTRNISTALMLDQSALNDLIDMTPYTYKAKLARKSALRSRTHFETIADFYVFVFALTNKTP